MWHECNRYTPPGGGLYQLTRWEIPIMRDQVRTTRAAKLQTNEPGLQNNLDGSVTIYREGDIWHIIARSGSRIFKEQSHNEIRAQKYARDLLALHIAGGLY